jgi:ABC-type Na+ efflux pump permease subunit
LNCEESNIPENLFLLFLLFLIVPILFFGILGVLIGKFKFNSKGISIYVINLLWKNKVFSKFLTKLKNKNVQNGISTEENIADQKIEELNESVNNETQVGEPN